MSDEFNSANYSERIAPYLEAMTVLAKKYGFVIDGCGCCGSPFVSVLGLEDACINVSHPEDGHYMVTLEGDLRWVAPETK